MILDELLYRIGATTDDQSFKKATKSVQKLTDVTKKFIAVTLSAASATLGVMTLVNKNTTEHIKLANAVGQNIDTMEALSIKAEGLGLNYENIIDLAEEMNNKIGESIGLGEVTTPVTEALQILGITFAEIKKLKPEEQFEKIVDAAIALGDPQLASSATDILFGGEASKFIGDLARSGKGLAEIKAEYKALNFETERSRKGAQAWQAAMKDVFTIGESITRSFNGLLGEAMEGIMVSFRDWVAINKELIKQGIQTVVNAIALAARALWMVLRTLGNAIAFVVDQLGGMEKVGRALLALGMVAGVVALTRAVLGLGVALLGLTKVGKGLSLAGVFGFLKKGVLLAAIVAVVDDVRAWVAGENSIMEILAGDWEQWKKDFKNVLDWAVEEIKKILYYLNPAGFLADKVAETARGAAKAMIPGEGTRGTAESWIQGLSNYMYPTPTPAMATAGSGGTTTVNNKTTINVTGDNPQAIASAVQKEANNVTTKSLQPGVK